MTRGARALTCAVLSLLLSCLLLGGLLRSVTQTVNATAAARGYPVRVVLLPAASDTAPPAKPDAALQVAPIAGELSGQHRPGDADDDALADYLPVSRLTEWPRLDDRRPPAVPATADAGLADMEEDEAVGDAANRLAAGAADALPSAPGASNALPAPVFIEAVLLINEQGQVDQLSLPDEGMSDAQRRQLQAQFRALRFTPGQLFGRPVRSRLRIELMLH